MHRIKFNVIQEIIRAQNFKNPAEVYSFLKNSFKDVLQEMLEIFSAMVIRIAALV